MNKRGAYLGMAVIVATLVAGDLLLYTSSANRSRMAREVIEKLGGGKIQVLDVTASLDGVVTLEGVRVQLGGPGFRPQEADRAVIEFRKGHGPPVRRVTLEGVRLRLSPELLEELGKGESKKTISDLFPNPDDLPQIVVQHGRLEASLPEIFPEGPQPVLLRQCTLTPDVNHRAHVQGIVESPLYGRWSAKGYLELDRGAFGLALEAGFLLIEPRMREPLAPRFQRVYEKYLPGGECGVTVELGKEPGSEVDFKVAFRAHDMQFNYKQFPYQIVNASGEIDFFRKGFHIKHMTGEHDGARIRLSGTAAGHSPDSGHQLRIDLENVALDADLRAALQEKSRKALDRFAPSGRVDARVTVSREPGAGKTVRIPVEISANGVSLTFREFPYELRNVTGGLRVDGEEIQVRRLVSREGETTVAITGSIHDLAGDATADVEIEARGVPLDERLKGALPEEARKAWEALSPGGALDGRWRLLKEKGRPLDWTGTLRARGNTLRHADFPVAVSDLEGEVELSPGRVLLRRLAGKAHGARVGAHGTIAGGSVELDFDAAGLVIDDPLKAALPPVVGDFLKGLKLGGVVGFMAGYRTRKGGQKQFTVDLKLSKGVLDTEPRIEEAEGHAALEGFHDQELLMRGPVTFSTATIAGKRVTDVGASLSVKGPKVHLLNLKATSYGGLLAGKSLSIDTKSGDYYCESLTVDRLDLREFALDTQGYAKKALGGRASLVLRDLAGRGADLKTITGKGRLTIRDGLLFEVPVFVSLFTLNPQELFKSRQQFDTGAIDFEVKERKFAIEKLSFSSEGASVLGQGTVGFDGTLDLVLKTKTGFFGIDFLPINLVTGLFDELKGAFHGVAVTGTFENPETSQKFFPGLGK